MDKAAIITLISMIDKAVAKNDMPWLYERCGILLPELQKLDAARLSGDFAVAFTEAIYIVKRWSADVRGANTAIWPNLSDKLKQAVEVIFNSSERVSEGVVKKFWSDKQYTILNPNLGSGAFGRTLLIKDEDIGLEQVAKVYEPKHIKDEASKTRFFQFFKEEIRILHALNHRNIVRIFAAHLYPAKLTGIVLMEYIKGKTLGDYLREYKRLPA